MRNPPAGDRRASANVIGFGKLDSPQDNRSAPRLQYLAELVHRLGPRALHELIVELVAARGDDIVRRLEVYDRLDPRTFLAIGGDKFPRRFAALAGGRQ